MGGIVAFSFSFLFIVDVFAGTLGVSVDCRILK